MVIKAKCRNCNREVPSDQFKLHYKYKMMVCPDCFSGKTEKLQEKVKKKEAPPKPPGWDAEDDYLERASRLRQQEQQIQFKKIPGMKYIQGKCLKCNFVFKYDPFKKLPHSCPYCNADILKLNTFGLL